MRDGGRVTCSARQACWRWAVVALIAVCVAPAKIGAQQAVTGNLTVWADGVASFDDSPDRNPKVFTVSSQSGETIELLAEFRRNVERKTWDRAFQSLDKLPGKAEGLLPTTDGLLLPFARLLREQLSQLPPDGQEAYRLFYDAQARQLMTAAEGPEETTRLEAIYERHFFTSVGDRAADRLGDLYFERGDLMRAADCWLAIVDAHPATKLSKALLSTKSAVALARAGRRDELASLVERLGSRYAGERVTIGGQDVEAAEFARGLLADLSPSSPATETLAEAVVSSLPAEDAEVLWQFRFFGPREYAAVQQMMQNWGGQQLSFTQLVPPTAVAGSRLYGNLLGRLFALDLETGKLVWRTQDFKNLIDTNNHQPPFFVEQDAITLGGGRLWAIVRGPGQLQQQMPSFLLQCRDPATGEAIWTSQTVTDLKAWKFCGEPLADADAIYVTAFKSAMSTELHALCLSAADGAIRWKTLIGTHQTDPQQMQWMRSAQPRLVADAAGLYVDTHAGALVRLNRGDGTLTWAAYYDTMPPNANYAWQASTMASPVGPPLLRDGILYVKGMWSNRLVAIDTRQPSWAWKRPVPVGWALVGFAGERLLTGGDELAALDVHNRSLLWASKLPLGTGWTEAVIRGERLYQFTPRGVFEIDAANGDSLRVFRGADLGSLGGQIRFTPQLMITVSNQAITAYPLPATQPSASREGHPRRTLR